MLLVKGNSFKSQFRVADADKDNALSMNTPLTYVSPRGDYSTLERVSNGAYVRTMKDGMIYNFDSSGFLLSEVDRNGNKIVYCYYSGTDRLKCIKDPNGMEYSFAYGSDNYLDSITDPQGRVTSFEHDASGHLIRITDPDNTTREFSYNDKGLMTAQMDKRGNLANYIYTERKDPLGHKTKYFYHRLTGNLIAQRDSLRNTTLFEPDPAGNIIQITDPNGHFVKQEYDDLNRLTKSIDAEAGESVYAYDNKGNLMSLTDERSHTTTYAYDVLDRLIVCLFFLLALLAGCGAGGSKECQYYKQAKQGGSKKAVTTENKAIKDLQKQIAQQCVSNPLDILQNTNTLQCRDRLLEQFKHTHTCE